MKTLLLFAALHQSDAVITVLDQARHAVSAATVSLTSETGNTAKTCQTAADGSCHLTLAPGKYRIAANANEQGAAPSHLISIHGNPRIELIVEPAFFDEPQFTVSGVKDNTYRGGHGADTVLRSTEDLSKATQSLGAAVEAVDPVQAVSTYQAEAQRFPTEPNYFRWGAELLSHLASNAAASVFTKGSTLFPLSTRIWLGLASALYAGGAYQPAAEAFYKASDLAPASATPYEFMALVKAPEMTALPGYRDRLARFARLQPGNAFANYAYAVSLAAGGHADESLPYLRKATQLDPRFALAYLQLASVQAANGETSEAISNLQSALAQDPSLEEAHYRLAQAYRLTANPEAAKRELVEYQRLNHDNGEQRERERRKLRQFVIKLKAQ